MRTATILMSMALLCAAPALAEAPEQGDNEVQLALSYVDLDLGEQNGFDAGERTDATFALSYGWYLTDHHEVGAVFQYQESEFQSGGETAESDGIGYGAFYHYNFGAGETATPFLGVRALGLGGDLGDAYDFQYDVTFGVKIYPFDHAGVLLAASYGELQGAEDNIPDADGLTVEAGILMKY
jgi:hypothetical protein